MQHSHGMADFFEKWMTRHKHYLNELIISSSYCEDELKELIPAVVSHYHQWYEAKSRAIEHNVHSLFSPTWFTSYERSYLWITGFKPSLMLNLVCKSVNDMSEEQLERMEVLKTATKIREKELDNESGQIQEEAACKNFVEVMTQLGKESEEEVSRLEERMQSLVHSVDSLAECTMGGVLPILSLAQSVKFLTANAQFQIKIRVVGKQLDAQRQRLVRCC